MSISQAGVYSLKLYENKGFEFDYDSNGLILLSSISNTGDTLELETNDNFIKYSNALVPAENNTTLNDHTLAFEINGLDQSNLDIIEKLQSSIYGWIALITFMDNQVYLINIPFHPKYDKFDSQATHTFFVELKPRIFTLEKLEEVVEVESVKGVLAFNGSSDVQFDSIPDVTGTKTISFYLWLNNESGYSNNCLINFADSIGSNDKLSVILTGSDLYVGVGQVTSNTKLYPISGLGSQFLFIEIDKQNSGSTTITDLRINSVSQSGNVGSFAISPGGAFVGSVNGSVYFLNNAYIWGITIDPTFTADGQPEGNTDAAWSQSIAATVFGSPTIIDLP